MPISGTLVTPSALNVSRAAVSWPCPPSIRTRSGQGELECSSSSLSTSSASPSPERGGSAPTDRREAPSDDRLRAGEGSSSSLTPTRTTSSSDLPLSEGGRGESGASTTRGASLSNRLNRRVSTSRIMPKSSPGVRLSERMLNLRYWFFCRPSGPATIIAPTALLPWMWLLS